MTDSPSGLPFPGYHYDTMSLELWRQVVDATTEYESDWSKGKRVDPIEFAAKYSKIPSEILVEELVTLKRELEDSPPGDMLAVDSTSDKTADRYEDLQLFRKGGMGEIYRAWDRECKRHVAIKKIREEYADDQDARVRFHTEAEITAGLEHPGILPIYSNGLDSQGREYYAMRWVGGASAQTLRELIDGFHQSLKAEDDYARGPQAYDSFMALIRHLVNVVDTIAYAHHHGVVHRDLKPTNILIGAYGETIIADWGLAKRVDGFHESRSNRPITCEISNTANTGKSDSVTDGVGTPGFAAPEVESGAKIPSLKSLDIYSLGAILQCILCGTPQKSDTGDLETTSDSMPTKVSLPGHLRPLQKRLSMLSILAIARKSMSHQPSQRYSCAEELSHELKSWLAGEAVLARPEGLWEQAVRWPNRNRTAAAAMAASLAVFGLGSIIFMLAQSHQKHLLKIESIKLTNALDETSRLLGELEKSQKATGAREIIAFDALTKIQNSVFTSPERERSKDLISLQEGLLVQSRKVIDSLFKQLETETNPQFETVDRLYKTVHLMSVMETEMGHPTEALSVLASLADWLKNYIDANGSKAVHFSQVSSKLGELRSLQGNTCMLMGETLKAVPLLEESLSILDPILANPNGPEDVLAMSKLAWVKSATAIAQHLVRPRETSPNPDRARSLIEKSKKLLSTGLQETSEKVMVQVQLHGNASIVYERLGDLNQAIEELTSAIAAAKSGIEITHQAPEQKTGPSANVLIATQLLRVRSKLYHERARMHRSNHQSDLAESTLLEILGLEAESIQRFPKSPEFLGAYQRTNQELKTSYIRAGESSKASALAEQWIELAQQRLEKGNAQNDRLFLVLAIQNAGQICEQTDRVPEAISYYQRALVVCDEDSSPQRSPRLLVQQLEICVRLTKIMTQTDQSESALKNWERAVEIAIKLQHTVGRSSADLQKAIGLLREGISAFRNSGFNEQASRMEFRLQELQLL